MMLKFNKYEKIYESLPRQSTVDQLKRIREEIKKSQNIKVGPEETTMKGDVGDRVVDDLVKHKGINNLFWWDNPIDRHIDSYETFVKDDSRKSLGYSDKGDPKSHDATDYVKKNNNNMKNLKTYEEWNPFKRTKKEEPKKFDPFEQKQKEDKMISDEAKKAGYDDPDEYMEMLYNTGQITSDELAHYRFDYY